ncbi:hypothetical protein DUI87_06082 [Hirundo rustica rustica]|uniref:Integrase catalytic domain-containing protein n=1 Tax=Hirundo rustica rustica TaxID=333673 RepID=A0A3M0KU41_HIRRU|nr:hypothetical protein DUI87_06082 [Hirundo rustica rustica]
MIPLVARCTRVDERGRGRKTGGGKSLAYGTIRQCSLNCQKNGTDSITEFWHCYHQRELSEKKEYKITRGIGAGTGVASLINQQKEMKTLRMSVDEDLGRIEQAIDGLVKSSKNKYGEAWQIDYITLPQTRQGKRCVLTMVEATTGWLETYPVPHATARNTILGLEKQILWRHGTPERIESDNGTHFKNSLINTWAREHGIEWVYHIPYHAPTADKVERHNALLKTQLKALGGGSFKNWEQHLAKATWLVNT